MAGLPLYLIAIPLRRSFAAGMDDDVISYNSYMVKTLKRQVLQRGERGAYMRLVSATLPLRHPERSEAESKDPAARPSANATGFLDFARNDSVIYNNFSRVRSCESTMPTGTLSSSITTRSSMR